MLAAESADLEQAASHQVTILLCDGTQAAQLPKAIQHLCSFAGQFGPQKGRLHVPLVLSGRASHAFFVLGTQSSGGEGLSNGGVEI